MKHGDVVGVRADGVELVFDELDADGNPTGWLRQKDGLESDTRLFDVWTKVGDWKRVDQ